MPNGGESMRCTVCNTEIEVNAKFCSNCGSAITMDPINQNVGFIQQTPKVEGWYNDNNRVFNPQTGLYTAMQNQMPMKWYKFLIYFSLFAGAALNCYNAIQILTGKQYTYNGFNQSDRIYSYYSGLQAVDIIYGLLIIVLSMFGIVTRQKLKGFSKQGPKFILWFYVGSLILSLTYLVIVTLITEIQLSELLSTRFVTSITTGIIMIFANKTYFANREHLFIN